MSDQPVLLTESTYREHDNMLRDYKRWRATSTGSVLHEAAPTFFVNRSGHEIPAYGAFQCDGIEKIANLNHLKAVRPNDYSAAQSVLYFNGPKAIADGDTGIVQDGPVFRALSTATLSIGDRLGASHGGFKLGLGCLYVHLGPDDIEDDCIRVSYDVSVILFEATEDIAEGAFGIVHRLKRSGTSTWTKDTTRNYTAYNLLGTEVTEGAKGKAFPTDGVWSIVEVC